MSDRELFNEWIKHYEKHDVKIDQLQRAFMWQAWQASTNRQGYKLVPAEPTQEMLDKFPEVIYQDTYVGECYIWVDDETICNGYKAMIGACDD